MPPDTAGSPGQDRITNSAALQPGDRVLAQWANGLGAVRGEVVKFLNTLGDGSRVFSVNIVGTEYAFNERDLVPDPADDPYLELADKILGRLRGHLARALSEEGL